MKRTKYTDCKMVTFTIILFLFTLLLVYVQVCMLRTLACVYTLSSPLFLPFSLPLLSPPSLSPFSLPFLSPLLSLSPPFSLSYSVAVVLSFFSNEQTYRSLENFQTSLNNVAAIASDYADDTLDVSSLVAASLAAITLPHFFSLPSVLPLHTFPLFPQLFPFPLSPSPISPLCLLSHPYPPSPFFPSSLLGFLFFLSSFPFHSLISPPLPPAHIHDTAS